MIWGEGRGREGGRGEREEGERGRREERVRERGRGGRREGGEREGGEREGGEREGGERKEGTKREGGWGRGVKGRGMERKREDEGHFNLQWIHRLKYMQCTHTQKSYGQNGPVIHYRGDCTADGGLQCMQTAVSMETAKGRLVCRLLHL